MTDLWRLLVGMAIGLFIFGVYCAIDQAKQRERWREYPRYGKPVSCLVDIEITCDKEVPDEY